jgi:ankyrin repeat protein
VKALISAGAQIESVDCDGCCALHYAAAYGYNEVRIYYYYQIKYSSQNQTIALLVQRGCRYAQGNDKGWTPLDYSYSDRVTQHFEECVRSMYDERKFLQKRRDSLLIEE